MRISVALTTLNGARHLPIQLESLLQQQRLPDELQVGDDGSTDNTLQILEDFAQRVPFPVHITENPKRLGYADNFLQTASRCQGDWIAFCDQDDRWLPHKLSRLEEVVRAGSKDLVMVVHDCAIVDEHGKTLPGRFPGLDQTQRFERNQLPGFSVHPGMAKLVRRRLVADFDFCIRPRSFLARDGALTHDKWTNLLANALGQSQFLAEVLAEYRRHGSNASMLEQDPGLTYRFRQSLRAGAEVYRFRSQVAGEIAKNQRRLAQMSQEPRLYDSAVRYERLAEVFGQRARVHEVDASGLDRLRAFVRLVVRDGGYFGDPFWGQGGPACVKDAWVALLGRRRVDRWFPVAQARSRSPSNRK